MSDETVKTIADIARLAGVSKSTVSRALNDSSLIGVETKERIRAIARQHHFQLNQPAQCLSRKETRTIAFVAHIYYAQKGYLISSSFIQEILGALSAALSQSGYDLLTAFVDPNETSWPQHYLNAGRADGFILIPSSRKQRIVKNLMEMNAPFIIWGYPLPGYHHCSVNGDDFTGGLLATRHLIQSGRRRIAFIGGPSSEPEVQGRYRGYEAALSEAGLAVDPALVTYGYYSGPSGVERMQSLLEQVPDLDAVFANSDLMAIAIMNMLHDRGCRIPDDIAVVGYDDLTIAEQCYPPLTTISQNIPLAGSLLAQNLIQHLQTGAITNASIPAELVLRKSA